MTDMKVLFYYMRGEREAAEAYIAGLRAEGVRVSPRDGQVFLRTPQMERGFNQFVFSSGAAAGASFYKEAGHEVKTLDLDSQETEIIDGASRPKVEVPATEVDPAAQPWHELEKAASERLGRAPADRAEAEAAMAAPLPPPSDAEEQVGTLLGLGQPQSDSAQPTAVSDTAFENAPSGDAAGRAPAKPKRGRPRKKRA